MVVYFGVKKSFPELNYPKEASFSNLIVANLKFQSLIHHHQFKPLLHRYLKLSGKEISIANFFNSSVVKGLSIGYRHAKVVFKVDVEWCSERMAQFPGRQAGGHMMKITH